MSTFIIYLIDIKQRNKVYYYMQKYKKDFALYMLCYLIQLTKQLVTILFE